MHRGGSGGALRLSTPLLLFAGVLGAMALRLVGLDWQSIAFDEGFSLAVSSSPWPLLFRAILSDGVHPPLFYVLFKFALALYGKTEFGARFLTAVFSVAAVPLLYRLGKTLFGGRVGRAAALLLAVNPVHIWLAGEARMYSLFIFLAIFNFWMFWRFLRRARRRDWFGMVGSAALVYGLHYFGLLLPVIQFLFILFTFRRSHRRLMPWVIGQATAGVPLLPWLALTAMRRVKSFGIAFLVVPTPADLLQSVWNLTLGLAPHLPALAAPGLLVVATGLALGVISARRDAAALLAGLWAFAPLLLVWLMSQKRSFYADRYLSFTIPALLLLIASGLYRLGRLRWGNGLVAALILLSLVNHWALKGDPAFWKDDWRGAAAYITARQRPDDIILLRSAHIKLPFDYYYHGPATEKLTSFNVESYDVSGLVEPGRRTWVVMPYTRRPTHYPMQPLTDASVWALDPDAGNVHDFLQANESRILLSRRFLGVQVWLVGEE
ncbi:MAG: hypothetical protein D6796_15505 [Caldilineae bacterium]|nr:MAG: hypothetical protein D6796_15505 [Caldilineae bacterium]